MDLIICSIECINESIAWLFEKKEVSKCFLHHRVAFFGKCESVCLQLNVSVKLDKVSQSTDNSNNNRSKRKKVSLFVISRPNVT